MSDTRDSLDRLIAFVEGQLPLDQRASFERELQQSPELQRRLELMQRIDRSLVTQFAPPRPIDLPPSMPVTAPDGAPWRRWAGLVATAAAASILFALAWFYFVTAASGAQPLTVASLYQKHVARGFVPDWVCKDDQEFIDTTRQAFGIPLLARTEGNVEIIGWAGYGDRLADLGLSPAAKEILARVDGREVMVLIDKPAPARPPRDNTRKLNVFERRIGDVALYEITPLDRPAAIERFELKQ